MNATPWVIRLIGIAAEGILFAALACGSAAEESVPQAPSEEIDRRAATTTESDAGTMEGTVRITGGTGKGVRVNGREVESCVDRPGVPPGMPNTGSNDCLADTLEAIAVEALTGSAPAASQASSTPGVSAGTSDGVTCTGDPNLFFRAIQSGDTRLARCVIGAGVDVNARNSFGQSLLGLAIQRGDAPESTRAELVQMLIEAGSDVNSVDNRGNPVLLDAIERGNSEIVGILLSAGADGSARDYSGRPLLYSAVSGENPEIAMLLVSAGVDVNSTDSDGVPVVLLWALQEKNVPVLEMLVEGGADVNVVGRFGDPVLSIPIDEGSVELLEILVNAGADVNLKDRFDKTLLMRAVTKGNPEIVGTLVAAGADVNVADSYGETVLSQSVDQGNVEIVEILVNAGADVNVQDSDGYPIILRQAIQEGNTEIVRILIAAGADVNGEDVFGNLPLDVAMREGEREIIQLLLDAGATSRNPKSVPTPTPSVYHDSFYREYKPGDAHLTSEHGDYQLRLATISGELGLAVLMHREVYEYLSCEIYDLLEYPADPDVVQRAIDSGKLRNIPGIVAQKTGEPEKVREAIARLDALGEVMEAMQVMAPTILWDYCANDVFEGYGRSDRRSR